MALVIEDGSGVVGANSYGNVADARTYAAARGVTLSVVDADLEVQMILAMDYLEALAFVGRVVSFTQALSWPRKLVQFDIDTPFPDDEIPPQLILAQYQLCIEQANGINLQPTVDHSQGGFITEEKVDVLLTKYSEQVGTTSEPMMPKVDALLRGIILPIPMLRTVRM